MEAFLDARDLREAVEKDYEVGTLRENQMLDQIKNHKGRKQRKSKAKCCQFSAVSPTIFTKIVTLR